MSRTGQPLLLFANSMITKILHIGWFGGEIPDEESRNIDRFMAINPDFLLQCWHDKNLSMLDMDWKWARRVFPKPAGLSNLVRLVALKKFGGIWSDCDVICHKPLDPFLENQAFAAFQDHEVICNAFMGAVADHPWIEWQLKNINKYEGHDPSWGPYLATEAPREGLTIVDSNLVYPYLYDSPQEKRIAHPDSIVEHLWKGSWL